MASDGDADNILNTESGENQHVSTRRNRRGSAGIRPVGSYSKTIRHLGYPGLELLKRWVALRDAGRLSELPGHKEPVRCQTRTRCAHCRVALEEKWSAVRRCFEDGESVTDVATELGFSR